MANPAGHSAPHYFKRAYCSNMYPRWQPLANGDFEYAKSASKSHASRHSPSLPTLHTQESFKTQTTRQLDVSSWKEPSQTRCFVFWEPFRPNACKYLTIIRLYQKRKTAITPPVYLRFVTLQLTRPHLERLHQLPAVHISALFEPYRRAYHKILG